MSTVATIDTTAQADDKPVERSWVRTPEQEKMVSDHLARVARDYANADPAYRALLEDRTILGTPEVMEMLGYAGGTRVFQLYTKATKLGREDQTPHPSAVPEADATAGRRGPRDIRGTMKGRLILWAVQSGRWRYDLVEQRLVPTQDVNHGGAPLRS